MYAIEHNFKHITSGCTLWNKKEVKISGMVSKQLRARCICGMGHIKIVFELPVCNCRITPMAICDLWPSEKHTSEIILGVSKEKVSRTAWKMIRQILNVCICVCL